MSEIQGILPGLEADDVSKSMESDFKEYGAEAKRLMAFLTKAENGEFITDSDFKEYGTTVTAHIDELRRIQAKDKENFNERVAQHIASTWGDRKEEMLTEIRASIGEYMQGGNDSVALSKLARTTGWVEASNSEGKISYDPRPLKGIEAALVQTGTRVSIGGGVEAQSPYVQLLQADPFMMDSYKWFPSDPSFTVPILAAPTVTVDGVPPDSVAASITSTTANLKSFDITEHIAGYLLNDLPAYREAMTENHMNSIYSSFGSHSASVAAVRANGLTKVKTGVADALPNTKVLALAAFNGMMAALKTPYRTMSTKWHMNPSVEAVINTHFAEGGGINYDITTGVNRFLGFPVIINSNLADGDAADEVPCLIASWRHALVQAVQIDVSTSYYPESKPGNMTFYSLMRAVSVLRDNTAGARMEVEA